MVAGRALIVLLLAAVMAAETVTDARAAVAASPDDATAWHRLGVALRLAGDGGAGGALRRAAELAPTDARILADWGDWRRREPDGAVEAEAAFRAAVASDATCALAWFGLGTLDLQAKRYAEARELFRTAAACDADFVPARFFAGRCSRYLGELDDAVAQFRAVLERRPDYVHALTYLVRVEQERGDLAARDAARERLLALRAAGLPALQGVRCWRRDRLSIDGVPCMMLEYFEPAPWRWRMPGNGGDAAGLLAWDGAWYLVVEHGDRLHALSRYDTEPSYDAVRAALLAGWPDRSRLPAAPAGIPAPDQVADGDLDQGQ